MAKIRVDLARAYRLLEPGPVVLLTSQYRGVKNIMSAAWYAVVSTDPPRVAIAIFPGRHTYGLVAKGGDLVLNIPARPLAEQVQRCGTLSGEEVDKFLAVHLTVDTAKAVNSPWIVECVAHVECGVVEILRTGDHALVIAEMVSASAEETAFDGEYWTLADESVRPLQHLGKNVYAVLGNKIQV